RPQETDRPEEAGCLADGGPVTCKVRQAATQKPHGRTSMPGLNRAAWFAAGAVIACGLTGAASAQVSAEGLVAATPKLPLPLHEPKPVAQQTLLKPADGDWLMFRRTLNGWGYS